MTAAVSQAEKMRLAELMNLQSHLVDHLDEGHSAPVADHHEYSGHHYNSMKWETIHPETADADGVMHCPVGYAPHWLRTPLAMQELAMHLIGYARIGCCKCVLDDHAPEHHLVGTEHHDLSPTIHGSHLESNADFDYDYRGTMYGHKQEYGGQHEDQQRS